MAYTLIGKNFTPPDVVAKVTGKAKYAEDFRADGMAFCKLLLSPIPHGRIKNIDTREALALQGVYGILTADDLPPMPAPRQPILNNEPTYVGEPILAVAAASEAIAADAIEKIKIEFEELPFTVDPLQSLYPGGPDAHATGNLVTTATGEGMGGGVPQLKSHKWTAQDFADAGDDKLPTGAPVNEWAFGDFEAGLKEAALVLDESFITAANPHHSMEPRSSFAYWQNGKCFIHGSTQSQSFVMPGLAQLVGVPPDQLVYISEFCGGGFGSKGSAYPVMTIPAHMAKKINRPCLLRITRAEEYFLGSARSGFQGRVKLGFDKIGKLIAADLYIVQQNGANTGFFDYSAAGDAVSLMYTPSSMRFRSISICTNTPPCGPQRGPGQNQIHAVMEPLLDKAARQLGIDRLKIRELNAPGNDAKVSGRQKVSISYAREVLALGAQKFAWEEKAKRSGERKGSKVIGVGVGQGYHSASGAGFDGLLHIDTDGKLHIHSGVGNLGTYSYASTARVAAEVLGCDWEECIIERGDSRRNLPWNLGQFGSNTSGTMTRTNYAAAMDAKLKLQEIAAKDLGGAPEDYEVGGQKVYQKANPDTHLTFARAAHRAIELGGKYDGHEPPQDIFFLTQAAVAGVAGKGLVGVAKDNLKMDNHIASMATSFILIELDTETGKYDILEYVGATDCGTVVHPMSLATQMRGGAVMGFGMAGKEQPVYDPQNGLPANVSLYQCKPPSYLDVPPVMEVAALDKPDPDNPMGIKGAGEPPMGAAASALLCAISDALGGHYFNRTPVVTDMIINAAAGRPQSHKPLAVNTQ
ncbi:MAG TPA: xanthine dehydrogenase family protein molybdopterin-binding subunit [Gammaproteobacteria bacterium]|nr:xanthine dehydrogenase family protein molybdopterin-binding subunit [Gammaproteobacteria bacterium]